MRTRIIKTEATNHEDLIADKGFNSSSHHSLVRKPGPTCRAMKIPDAKAVVDKEWAKLEKLLAWQVAKNKSKKKRHPKKGTKVRKTIHICYIGGLMPLQELGGGTEVPKVQRARRAPRLCCEGASGSYPVFAEQEGSSTNDGRESSGRHRDITRMRQPSQRRDIRLHPSQFWRTLQSCCIFPSLSVWTYGYVYHGMSGPNHCSKLKNHRFPSERRGTDIPLQLDCCGKKQFEQVFWKN